MTGFDALFVSFCIAFIVASDRVQGKLRGLRRARRH